jgi:uncharacterized DUF497 family protein
VLCRVSLILSEIELEWDSRKAASNQRKHGVPFESACETFFDPFLCVVEGGMQRGEIREESRMKINKVKQRLKRNRAMTTISIRMPEDVVEDLKEIAPRLGFSGYQPLIRAYIGQGLRVDLESLSQSPDLAALIKSLKKRGVKDEVIASAVAESRSSRAA